MDKKEFTQRTMSKLEQSIQHLEISVTAAREKIAQKYGVKHPTVVRLDGYFPSILGQKKYVQELSKALENQNEDEVSRLVSIINSISLMIKEDARDIFLEMQGIACKTDKDLLH